MWDSQCLIYVAVGGGSPRPATHVTLCQGSKEGAIGITAPAASAHTSNVLPLFVRHFHPFAMKWPPKSSRANLR